MTRTPFDDLTSLMAGYQAGELEAFENLYARLAPTIRRYLLSLARDATWVEDLVQETFLQLHRARHTYNRAWPVQPWAIAIARHVFLMDCRLRTRKGDFKKVSADEAPEASAPAHDAAFIARDGLRRGLAGLTPRTRRAVLLHHVWGWSFEEVGARLGMRGAAAKLRASRGMAALREKLHDKQDNDGQ